MMHPRVGREHKMVVFNDQIGADYLEIDLKVSKILNMILGEICLRHQHISQRMANLRVHNHYPLIIFLKIETKLAKIEFN